MANQTTPEPSDTVPYRTHPQAPNPAGSRFVVPQVDAMTNRGRSSAPTGDGVAEANALRMVYQQIEDARRVGVPVSASVLAQRDALQCGTKPANFPASQS